MDRDEILKKSREENEGRPDEREAIAFLRASKAGMTAGVLACLLLAFASKFLFQIPEISLIGWFVYFAMQGSGSIALYRELGKRQKLIWGIIEIVLALAFFVAAAIKSAA